MASATASPIPELAPVTRHFWPARIRRTSTAGVTTGGCPSPLAVGIVALLDGWGREGTGQPARAAGAERRRASPGWARSPRHVRRTRPDRLLALGAVPRRPERARQVVRRVDQRH